MNFFITKFWFVKNLGPGPAVMENINDTGNYCVNEKISYIAEIPHTIWREASCEETGAFQWYTRISWFQGTSSQRCTCTLTLVYQWTTPEPSTQDFNPLVPHMSNSFLISIVRLKKKNFYLKLFKINLPQNLSKKITYNQHKICVQFLAWQFACHPWSTAFWH